MSQFSVESFSSHITKHFVEDLFGAVFQKNSGGEKKNYGKEGGKGEYRNFPSKFFVSKCRNISSGNPLLFHSFRVSNKFILQRVMPRFPVEFFFLTVRNIS